MAELRVALVGAGMISAHHLAAWAKVRGAAVTAICDPDVGRAEARAAAFGVPSTYPSLEALLAAEPVDALDVASPRERHAAAVLLAAERGLPVLCQKPLAPTLAEAEALVATVAGRSRLMVHENWRFRAWYREAAAWMAAGLVGRPVAAAMEVVSSGLLPGPDGRRPALERQPFMAGERRLLVAEALIHHLDVLRWLLGPLRVVAARLGRATDAVVGESLAAILLETAEGAPVTLNGNWTAAGWPPSPTDRFSLQGEIGSLLLADDRLRLLGPAPREAAFDGRAAYQRSFDDAIAHFVERLRTGEPFETDAAENLATLRLVEDCYRLAGA